MTGHPGGKEHSLYMIEKAGFAQGSRVLDLGAGEGDSVSLMRKLGIDAAGVDLKAENRLVCRGDMLALPFSDCSFDGLLSQCAFYVSGDAARAFNEAHRILKPGGRLAISDVFFEPLEEAVQKPGFKAIWAEDMTAKWREYYIEAIWRGTAACIENRKNCRYYFLLFEKEQNHGSF